MTHNKIRTASQEELALSIDLLRARHERQCKILALGHADGRTLDPIEVRTLFESNKRILIQLLMFEREWAWREEFITEAFDCRSFLRSAA